MRATNDATRASPSTRPWISFVCKMMTRLIGNPSSLYLARPDDGMANEHQVGERPQSPRRWRQVTRDLARRVEVHVADKSVLHHVQSRVQHNRARLEHLTCHQPWLPRADEEQ